MPSDLPNPGSDAALDAGCHCPVLDNAHGRGYMGIAGQYVINLSCPLHGIAPLPLPFSDAPTEEEE